ncbi:concanavalin A-like lectin/glucanase [Mollisia scopiformis]|uniref:Concanavalin A-like lectin/glucanase n=1 Tax=Mollisia scopiformis TaxID=149040 RepID=A0A194XPT3_MOLSC|nr:concanavalin A-like lectin/glucanase [Mollisia scopiformis]KUJ22171.1 concanavalin A-like lectin/glucanase [Mollisia scopiformis]
MRPLTITNVLLFISSVIAAPGATRQFTNKSQSFQRLANVSRNAIAHVYDTNWAGAVIETTGVTSVTGTFTVPSPSTPGEGVAWVGIDGNNCYTAILKTGVIWTRASGSTTTTYQGWYEWFPAGMSYWTTSSFPIKAGDVMTATVHATSLTSGTATLANKSTGKSISHS